MIDLHFCLVSPQNGLTNLKKNVFASGVTCQRRQRRPPGGPGGRKNLGARGVHAKNNWGWVKLFI